jgi:hypothetical protein
VVTDTSRRVRAEFIERLGREPHGAVSLPRVASDSAKDTGTCLAESKGSPVGSEAIR